LAKDGVLSEAVLAAEAWVRENPQNSDAWYQLGRIQAENDDDQQAIAAMSKAHEVNPQNPEVLLALAVSHANELDQDEALGHARGWLLSQPRFQHIAGVQNSQTPEQMLELFKEAARQAPNDADVQTVLGVMAHLTRNYDEAINAFEHATTLRPEDHSLWNKIGATRANGAESSEAIGAYRRALDLKPNYVRAWSNMGIGYANQGRYAESMPYYIRALSMNPNPDSPTWGYVRISLGCTGRLDLMHHCDSHNIEALRAEFPL
jgi:peroxin-5